MGGKFRLREILYWWDCGRDCKGEGSADCKKLCTGGIVGRIVKRREVQTARNCVLVGLWGENFKGEGSADCKNFVLV